MRDVFGFYHPLLIVHMTACITHPTVRVKKELHIFVIVIHCVIAHPTSPDCLQLQPNVLAGPPYSQPSFSLWKKKNCNKLA